MRLPPQSGWPVQSQCGVCGRVWKGGRGERERHTHTHTCTHTCTHTYKYTHTNTQTHKQIRGARGVSYLDDVVINDEGKAAAAHVSQRRSGVELEPKRLCQLSCANTSMCGEHVRLLAVSCMAECTCEGNVRWDKHTHTHLWYRRAFGLCLWRFGHGPKPP